MQHEESNEKKLLLYYRGTADELKRYIFNCARTAYLTTIARKQNRQKKALPA